MKKQEGITLIALVITIIVLLILAGVTIAMLSGENGILGRATQARADSKITNTEELITVNVADKVSEFYENKYVKNQSVSLKDAFDAGISLANAQKDEDVTITNSVTADATTGALSGTVTVTYSAGKRKAVGTINGNAVLSWAAPTATE